MKTTMASWVCPTFLGGFGPMSSNVWSFLFSMFGPSQVTDESVWPNVSSSMAVRTRTRMVSLAVGFPIGSMYAIYGNIGGILMGSMLPYIPAPWILWLFGWWILWLFGKKSTTHPTHPTRDPVVESCLRCIRWVPSCDCPIDPPNRSGPGKPGVTSKE